MTLVLLATRWVHIEVTALGIAVILAFIGLLTPEEALGGFSSPAQITVAATGGCCWPWRRPPSCSAPS